MPYQYADRKDEAELHIGNQYYRKFKEILSKSKITLDCVSSKADF